MAVRLTYFPPASFFIKFASATVNFNENASMKYNQLFRNLREARELTHDAVAREAHCHRNTVINVEIGRPVKFTTITKLMEAMGYAENSEELKTMALLWAEDQIGISFSQEKAVGKIQTFVERAGAGRNQAVQQLISSLMENSLTEEEVQTLIFAANNSEFLEAISAFRRLVEGKSKTEKE
jgi:DNA-binding XRE family transcriptional regulator